jgi:hypothetical protein
MSACAVDIKIFIQRDNLNLIFKWLNNVSKLTLPKGTDWFIINVDENAELLQRSNQP